MSTRERAQIIFDRLTDEQLKGFVKLFENAFISEPPNTVHSRAELENMLAEGLDDLKNGRVCSEEEMDDFFRGYCGI